MKKIIICLIAINITIVAHSQSEWAPIGAEWHYDNQQMLPFQNHGYTHYKVIKDTIVNSQLVKLIYKQVVYFNGIIAKRDSLYAYEENSKVYFLINDKFMLIYDFAVQVGDTIKLSPLVFNCDSVSPIVVDSIKTIDVNGTLLKRQYLSYRLLKKEYNNQIITDVITEKIGYGKDLIYYPSCGGETFITHFLRCYQDDLIFYVDGYWKSLYPNGTCDMLIYTDVEDIRIDKNITIYPNPTKGTIYIDSKKRIYMLEIYDLGGSKIKSYISNNITSADFSNFSKGFYLIKVTFNNNESYSCKILKN